MKRQDRAACWICWTFSVLVRWAVLTSSSAGGPHRSIWVRRRGNRMSQPVAEQSNGAVAFEPKGVVRPRVQIEQQIRSAILSGELPPGFRLQSEAELSRLFGVSRNTIREGLRSLETQGLIEKLPGAGGGSFVQRMDQQSLGKTLEESVGNLLKFGMIDVDELASVREYLEVPSVRLAA